MKKGLIILVFVTVVATGMPVFAQTYGYAQNYTPIYQNVYVPQYQDFYLPTTISYTNSMPSWMQSYAMPQQQYYQTPSYSYPSYNTQPSYTYPQNSYSQYGNSYYPQYSYDQSQYYPYTNTYKDPNSYPRYWVSEPEYDPSYAWFSDYYQEYPSRVGVYTGNTDLFGNPLCNWPGYTGYDCSYDPAQWVYDPYTGTWY